MKGRVFKTTGSFYWIRVENGDEFICRLKGNIRLQNYKFTNPAVVGDEVEFAESDSGEGIIKKIYPRKNYIVRKSVKLSKQAHILASNIDQAILVATLVEPKTYTEFIDRYLVTAEAYHIPAAIIFNKTDLHNEALDAELNELVAAYGKIGYPSIAVSALEDKDISSINEMLKGKTSLVSGYSGVGKTTLINRIDPDLNLRTQEVSEQHQSGLHTTTYAEMHKLSDLGYIIDTPGIKGLGVMDIKKEELSHYFIEMRELLHQCKFNNCVHIDEPKCAVKESLEKGELAAFRYKSYLNIYFDDEAEVYR